MQEDYEAKPVLDRADYKLQANDQAAAGTQSSVTYKAKAEDGHVVGSNGETLGIAKKAYQPGDDIGSLLDEKDQLRAQIRGSEDTPALQGDALNAANQRLQKIDKEIQDICTVASDTSRLYANPMEHDLQIMDRSSLQNADLSDRNLLLRSCASSVVDETIGTHAISEEKLAKGAGNSLLGVSVQVDGVGVSGSIGEGAEEKDYFVDIDYSRPEIQKGLSELEVNDYISGQIDRHPGNIFIDAETGKVTGIDNDQAFPSRPRADLERDESVKCARGMPRRLDEETATKLEKVDPSKLRANLQATTYPDGSGRRLDDAEIEGAVTRLKELQDGIKSGQIEVVEKFDDTTYKAAVDEQKAAYKQKVQENNKKYDTDVPENFDQVQTTQQLQNSIPQSYIGAIENERMKNTLGGDKVLTLGADDAVKKAQRNEEYQAFAELKRSAINGVKDGALDQTNPQIKAAREDLASMKEKAAQYQKQAEKLENPGIKDRIKSLRHGGVDGAKDHLEQKRQDLASRIVTAEQNLESLAESAISSSKPDMMKAAKKMVEDRNAEKPSVKDSLSQGNDNEQGQGNRQRAGSVGEQLGKNEGEKPDVPKRGVTV